MIRLAQWDRRKRRVVVDDPANISERTVGGCAPLECSVGPDRSVAIHGEHLPLTSGGSVTGIGVGRRSGGDGSGHSVATATAPLAGSQRRYGTCWLASGDTIV